MVLSQASHQLDNPVVAIGAGAAAGLCLFIVSATAVTIIMTVTGGKRLRTNYRENFGWLLPHHLVLGMVAGGLAVTYLEIGIASILVLALPLLLSRYAMMQFVDRTRDNVLRLERSNDQLQHAYVEIRHMSNELHEAYTGTLESLVTALDVRDQETRGHSVRVATHFARHRPHARHRRRAGSGLHLPRRPHARRREDRRPRSRSCSSPSGLTDEEWEFMRRHPAMGYRILAQVPYLRPAAKIVLAHHERWDGGGYPRRLKEENIPLGARVFALCDTYDAIISDRPYRRGQSPDAALAEILRCAGTQFDPTVVEAFEAAFPRWREETPGEAAKPLYLPSWMRKDSEAERRAS